MPFSKPASFQVRVSAVVQQIPRGKVLSYAEVARRAGNAKAARAVGNLMRQNFDPRIPCHRVIRTDGRVGDYNRGGTKRKIRLLSREGVKIEQQKVVR